MNTSENKSLMINQCNDHSILRANQIAVVSILIISAILIAAYGNIIFAILLGTLVLAIIFNKQINQNIYQKYSIASITRFMSGSGFPSDVQVQVSCRHRQKYVVLTTKKPCETTTLIIEVINPEWLNVHQLQQELKHFAANKIQVYLVIDCQCERADELKAQLTQYISVYHIFNLLDNCLVHIKGRLIKMTSSVAEVRK